MPDTQQRKAAVVTGGATGIGFATAQALAGAGYQVMIAGRRVDVLEEAVERLRAQHPQARIESEPTDVAVPEQAAALIEAAADRFGRLDALVSNAALLDVTPFQDLTMTQWAAMMGVVAGGAAATCLAAVPHLKAQGGGRIVLVGSVSGITSDAGLPHYGAAKAAVHALARGLAVDLAPFNISANAVAPGWVRTPMNDTFVDSVGPEFLRRVNPQARAADPAEIAEVIRYLVAEAPGFLSGATICVDGGQTAMNHYY
jgi:NAD(P)-dependent dehydrogenase (short-subunit alcohol dehydrogenase family)